MRSWHQSRVSHVFPWRSLWKTWRDESQRRLGPSRSYFSKARPRLNITKRFLLFLYWERILIVVIDTICWVELTFKFIDIYWTLSMICIYFKVLRHITVCLFALSLDTRGHTNKFSCLKLSWPIRSRNIPDKRVLRVWLASVVASYWTAATHTRLKTQFWLTVIC